MSEMDIDSKNESLVAEGNVVSTKGNDKESTKVTIDEVPRMETGHGSVVLLPNTANTMIRRQQTILRLEL